MCVVASQENLVVYFEHQNFVQLCVLLLLNKRRKKNEIMRGKEWKNCNITLREAPRQWRGLASHCLSFGTIVFQSTHTNWCPLEVAYRVESNLTLLPHQSMLSSGARGMWTSLCISVYWVLSMLALKTWMKAKGN